MYSCTYGVGNKLQFIALMLGSVAQVCLHDSMESMKSLTACLLEYCQNSACNGLIMYQVSYPWTQIILNFDNQIVKGKVIPIFDKLFCSKVTSLLH